MKASYECICLAHFLKLKYTVVGWVLGGRDQILAGIVEVLYCPCVLGVTVLLSFC